MKRAQTGAIVVDRKKFERLAYADDLALVAKPEKEMKAERKKLVKCRKSEGDIQGRRKGKENRWGWTVEEMK